MPSIASHFVVAKQVSKILNIYSSSYYLGNILPDIIDEEDSHKKIQGDFYLIPNIEKFIKSNRYERDVLIGYLTHLLLDRYFLEEFIPNNIKDYKSLDLFYSKKIYIDYTSINYTLVNRFDLDVEYIVDIINSSIYNLDKNKKEYNINCIRSTMICDSIYIDIEKYIDFLLSISNRIADDIKRWCYYD